MYYFNVSENISYILTKIKNFKNKYLFIVGMVINNEHKLCRGFGRLLKPETY